MIEMHFWEQLAAIAECGTLSAAAEKLYLTQPALSRSMKKLEEMLGVSLFGRGKNRIVLNDTGKMAASHAVRLLEYEADLIAKIRAYDEARHTIKVGSCAPVPLRELVPRLMDRYAGRAISAEVKEETALIRQFGEGAFRIIILTHPLEGEGLTSRKFLVEKMFYCVPKENPLAGRESVTMEEIDGQTILLYSESGFWYPLCRKKLPHSRLLLQTEFEVFRELANASAFPFFISSWHREHDFLSADRVCIPITDPDMTATYFCISRQSESGFLDGVL